MYSSYLINKGHKNMCRNLIVSNTQDCSFKVMAIENVITSPHRRTQTQTAFSPPSSKKQYQRPDEVGNCSALVQRHRFLLTALVLLAFLCTVYLYFAVTLGDSNKCSGLTGTQKVTCQLQQAKAAAAKGKLKFF